MLARLPIRLKLILALALWLITVSVLCWSSFEGLYAFRGLVKHLDGVAKLPRATALERRVNQLRLDLMEWEERERRAPGAGMGRLSSEGVLIRDRLLRELEEVRRLVEEYHAQSPSPAERGPDSRLASELETDNRREIKRLLATLQVHVEQPNRDEEVNALTTAEQLRALIGDLPRKAQSDVSELPEAANVAYRERMHAAWVTTLFAAGLTGIMLWILYRWVFRPLRMLIKGSRKFAAGDFDVDIQLESRDEMSELAAAMNAMTHEFRAIRDDLDRQVQERTAQAVRTERLAGVGFLAAGVADDISAPLAVIRDRAKTLQAALEASAPRSADASPTETNSTVGPSTAAPVTKQTEHPSALAETSSTALSELQAISAAAFRCKDITEGLLDLSRSGTDQRERFDIRELGRGVIDLLNRSGKYAHKKIELEADEPILIEGNAREIKQVVLSLLVHRLDRVNSGQCVTLQMGTLGEFAELIVSDDANGQQLEETASSTDLAEPSTVFGLSLAKCIVQDHGGRIDVPSWSQLKSGRQERVRVTLPLAAPVEELSHRYQVA